MNSTVHMQSKAFDRFKSETRGEVLVPSDPRYDETRQIWNAMIDRRPALIARCKSLKTSPVREVRAQERPARLGPRRRPQHRGQRRLRRRPDDRSVLDEAVQVDPARGAHVEPGCTLADFERGAGHGLATPRASTPPRASPA